MVLQVIRALFILLMAAIGWFYLSSAESIGHRNAWLAMPVTLAVGVLFVCVDILSPRRKLAVFSGAILGLIVGVSIAFGLSFVVKLLVDLIPSSPTFTEKQHEPLLRFIDVVVGIVCCYLATSFILQSKDDFRFIIPYVEFAKQHKGPRPLLLDTSVLIDGRIGDIAATGVLETQLIVPQFVLDELQAVADSADRLKRNRGRRGLDVLAALRADKRVDVKLYESARLQDSEGGVDQKLMRLAKELHARVATNDYNLNKVAQLTGVEVINLNDLANALKPVILPGEKMTVRIVRSGEEPGQGVGYLEDGTMVVVEQGRPHQGQEVEFTVTRALQTSAGRMIFGRVAAEPAAGAIASRRPRAQSDAPAGGAS
ncbi:MAG: integral rane protein domain superfamily [Phycisphaerales bacterium]|nr:integral rane protein domain superfamily [Phycisphaerales bacterium]